MSIVPMKRDDPEVLLASQGLVMADFYADWCAPCKSMAQILRDYEHEDPETVICAINIDERQQMAEQYGVMSIPTLLFFYDGQVVGRLVGLQSRETLRTTIKQLKQKHEANA